MNSQTTRTPSLTPVCICGLTYTAHPPADAPSACYRAARRDYVMAAVERLPFRDMTAVHRQAVIRRRLDLLEAAA